VARSPYPEVVEFGRRLRAHRHHAGWTQEQLAERSGLHWTFIGQLERAQSNLTLHTLVVLAAALEIDPSDLVKGLRPSAV
jgi:transcriptional regulator with XRE-family HTH domain